MKQKEDACFYGWLLFLAVYYGIRMFSLTPWYDELYTYYYFISRGPVYAAIHWPLPNNHIGYSVLSAFLDLTGIPEIGLRGISYLVSLASVFVLYRICKKVMKKGWSVCCIILFSSMSLVNQLAVQGRGYALSTLCLLTGILAVCEIEEATGKKKVLLRILFTASCVLGLYTVPTSVYWVLPLCIGSGLYYLIRKQYRILKGLIFCSVAAVLITVFFYTVVWLAIGSNLLSKQAGGVLEGAGHLSILMNSPVLALRTGIDYMLATPYIQGVTRADFFNRFGGWLASLFQLFYQWNGLLFGIVAGLAGFAVFVRLLMRGKGEPGYLRLGMISLCVLLFVPFFLTVQSTLPYYRVFSYLGVVLAVILCLAGQMFFPEKLPYGIYIGTAVTAGLLLLNSGGYTSQYGMNEYYAMDALLQGSPKEKEVICVTDCNQQYLLKYKWDITCESTQIVGADLVVLSKNLADPEVDQPGWEYYHSYATIPWDYLEDEMKLTYENEGYLLYTKNKDKGEQE